MEPKPNTRQGSGKKSTPLKIRLIESALLSARRKNKEPTMIEAGRELIEEMDVESNAEHPQETLQPFEKSTQESQPRASNNNESQKERGRGMRIFRRMLILAMLVSIFVAIVGASQPRIDDLEIVMIIYGVVSFFVLVFLILIKPVGDSWLMLEIEARKAKLRRRIRDLETNV